jgi:N-6 DNA Methylase
MEFPERFRWGWCATTGKKADLMFAQHMLAVCKERGMVATVMRHGVLFRGSAEKEIRRKFLEQDLIEAVIRLPPNLFYGASIPACILVMRPNLTSQLPNPNKPEARRGRVLFINADAEFHAGRAQNYLRPEHIEKIVSTFDRYEDVPAHARIVPVAEIADTANDFNLNIRRYVDNASPSEPHDVRAHLLGGVPAAEVMDKRPLFEAIGFNPAHIFAKRGQDPAYFDFAPAGLDRAAIRPLVEGDPGVQARQTKVMEWLAGWWTGHSPQLAEVYGKVAQPDEGLDRLAAAATREEVYIFAETAIAAGYPEVGAAAVICFEWLQRPENVLVGYIRWTDYWGRDAPSAIRITHHKTGAVVLHPARGRGWHPLLCRRRGRPREGTTARRPHRHARCSRQDRTRQSETRRALFGKRDGETGPAAAPSRQAVPDIPLGRLPPRRHDRTRGGGANGRPR